MKLLHTFIGVLLLIAAFQTWVNGKPWEKTQEYKAAPIVSVSNVPETAQVPVSDPYAEMSDKERLRGVILEPTN